jgi:hypothetical protein
LLPCQRQKKKDKKAADIAECEAKLAELKQSDD